MALTVDAFPETVRDNNTVFVVFWANWCPGCREFMPIYKYAAQRHRDLVFGTADTEIEEQREIAGYFGLQVIPTVVAVKEGHMVRYQPGGMSHQQFADMIRDVRATDVNEAVMAAAQAAAQPARPGVILGGSRLR
ncbi:MAG TPA: thioredoxin family protein [Actinocatenispora sp.]